MNSKEYLLKNAIKIPNLSAFENGNRLISYSTALFAIDIAKKEKIDDTEKVVLLQHKVDNLKAQLSREQARCSYLRQTLRKQGKYTNKVYYKELELRGD